MLEEGLILQLPIDELGLEACVTSIGPISGMTTTTSTRPEMLATASQPWMRSLRQLAGFGRVGWSPLT